MTCKTMTGMDIAKRIGGGDLVVYLDEEYGYRQWFWFPSMSSDELSDFWDKCNVEKHFFSPVGLPGDVVPVPPEEDEDCYSEADIDPRADCVLDLTNESTNEESVKACADYDAWRAEYFPNESMWHEGFAGKENWTAHIHMADDSYLRKPAAE